MSSEAKKLATYEDLARVPEHLIAEIIAGVLITSPRPGPRHARASSALGSEVFGPFDKGSGGPGGWWILDEPEVHLGGDVLIPDLAGWKKSKLPTLPGDKSYFEKAPDWVCEVLSPSTAGVDRVKKLPIYLREGVDHVWLIEPNAQTLEVYQQSGGRWFLLSTFSGTEKIRAAPFDAVEIDLGSLWLPAE